MCLWTTSTLVTLSPRSRLIHRSCRPLPYTKKHPHTFDETPPKILIDKWTGDKTEIHNYGYNEQIFLRITGKTSGSIFVTPSKGTFTVQEKMIRYGPSFATKEARAEQAKILVVRNFWAQFPTKFGFSGWLWGSVIIIISFLLRSKRI